MASKRNIRRKVCGNKVGHTDPAAARSAIAKLQKRGGFQGDLHYYVCPYCKKLHVGHKPGGEHHRRY